jgi:hypothetical protein
MVRSKKTRIFGVFFKNMEGWKASVFWNRDFDGFD